MVRRSGRPSLLGTAARTAVIAGTAQTVTGNVAARQQAAARAQQQAAAAQAAAAQAQFAPPPAPVAAAPAPSAGDDLIAQLERLGQLHLSGVLSADEFAAAKARLLG